MNRRRAIFVDRMVLRFGRERWNEHVKLFSSIMNSVAAACAIGGFVAPLINPVPPSGLAVPILFGAAVLLHMAAHAAFRYYRGKE